MKFLALNGGPQYTFSEAISYQVSCKNQDEVDHYWTRSPKAASQARAAG